MNNQKTPGPNKTKVTKIIFKKRSDYIIDLYNCILEQKEILINWKTERKIYFCKPNRSIKKVSDLQPITLRLLINKQFL